MKTFDTEIDLKTINQITNGEIVGKCNNNYLNVTELSKADAQSVCFFENEKYTNDFQNSKAGLIFIKSDNYQKPKENQVYIRLEKPYVAFMTLITWWLAQDDLKKEKTFSPLASIHPTATIKENVAIEAYVVIGENVTIGANSTIGANTVIMKGASIGENALIYPNVTIYENCVIGNKAIIHAGAVIGVDGFGFVKIEGFQIKIPQVGNVVIEDDVEIGANTCIDRATVGTTLIKSNTKLDNLVQIGHNSTIEEHSIIVSQVGIAGSTHIGKSVYLAGQVGVAGHLKIADDTMIGAQSGVAASLETGKYFGSPAINAFEQKKIIAAMKDLPKVVRYVNKLMKQE